HDDSCHAADDHGDGDEDQPDDDTPMSGTLERTTTYTSPLYGSPEPVAADEGPIRKVFDILERSRKSGTLTVRLPDELLTFYFDSGCVQSCQTDNREKSDRLGDLLLDFESCDEQRITELIRRSEGSTHLQLGELIVREGLASNGQIMDALETQTRRRFHRACSAPQGAYRFVEGPPLRTDGRVRISPMELAFESSWSPGD
ncbi:MAG: DUF4388 domain-containing protein, partial [Planctomycetes bacterium]|nr:DUF4388 domain-containing protein [Planctomycetota bacterium]